MTATVGGRRRSAGSDIDAGVARGSVRGAAMVRAQAEEADGARADGARADDAGRGPTPRPWQPPPHMVKHAV